MSTVPRPETAEQMIEQLWYAVIGSNGDGIAATVRRHSRDIEHIKDAIPQLLTKVEHDGCHDQERRRRWRTTDVGLAVMMLIVTVVTIAVQVM